MGDFVVIERYFQAHEAHLAKNALEAAGIKCMLLNEISTQVYNFFNPGSGGILLKVQEEDIDLSREILSTGQLAIDETFEVGAPEIEAQTISPETTNHWTNSIATWVFLLAALVILFALAAFIAQVLG